MCGKGLVVGDLRETSELMESEEAGEKTNHVARIEDLDVAEVSGCRPGSRLLPVDVPILVGGVLGAKGRQCLKKMRRMRKKRTPKPTAPFQSKFSIIFSIPT